MSLTWSISFVRLHEPSYIQKLMKVLMKDSILEPENSQNFYCKQKLGNVWAVDYSSNLGDCLVQVPWIVLPA